MIKGIIFDADGTLLDSMHIWDELGVRYLKSVGIKAEPDLSKILYPMSLEESSSYLKERYEISYSEEEIKEGIIGVIEDFYRYEVKLKIGVKEFLERMSDKAIPMIVATSSDKDILKLAFYNLGVLKFFSDIITCTELKTSKKMPDIYLRCAEIMCTNPKETIVFEDVLHGIKAARSAGFVTVAVNDFSSLDDREEIMKIADYYINDFTEIKGIKI